MDSVEVAEKTIDGRSPQGTGPSAQTDTARVPEQDVFGLALRDGFAKAVEAAVAKTLAAGVAVSSIEHGRATETRPDGQTRDIDESVAWSPHAWRET